MKKLIVSLTVSVIIVSLAVTIPNPVNASPLSTSPFIKTDNELAAERSLSSGSDGDLSAFLWIQEESTSDVPTVIDNKGPGVRDLWIPAGNTLLILEVPLSEPSGFNRENDSTGALLIYDE